MRWTDKAFLQEIILIIAVSNTGIHLNEIGNLSQNPYTKRLSTLFTLPCQILDISRKDCRDVPWNVSTRVRGNAHLIFTRCLLN